MLNKTFELIKLKTNFILKTYYFVLLVFKFIKNI